VDILRNTPWQEEPPIDLKTLESISNSLNISVGGWFLFANNNYWAYRSNMFGGPEILPQQVKAQKEQAQRSSWTTWREKKFQMSGTGFG
jgi:hypothetical protein